MQGCVAIHVLCISRDHQLITEESTYVSVATRSCQMQDCALLASNGLYIDILLDQNFTDVTMALVCSEMQGVPLVCTFGVKVSYLQHLYGGV